ncbi:uncharacterized protein LAESUDRAFT_732522 [Laetiporus sulphureus 93-53]|uniref:Uncharacterized protein n=1 Tax=Laetiporus sulphureus 93-53 TaxID=1314785 RepID=A0A165B482_9APHY|nr:uncharacterized protein LAESUDRAFT_732522 [Laetiporus sulphureus 93-53]KZT00193.1 hypothetical protein LAESUDRAFT_732522 [Laetiporus sulphureus 93-53]
MGLFGPSKSGSATEDPEIRQLEKVISSEARNDQKNVDHAIKDLKGAGTTHNKSVKAADKAQHELDKAIENEHKAAAALNKAEHQHESAIADQRNAAKTLELKKQQEARLEQDLHKQHEAVVEIQQRKASNDAMRESKLARVHEQAASRARSGSLDGSNGPAASGAATGAGTGTTHVAHGKTRSATVGANDSSLR